MIISFYLGISYLVSGNPDGAVEQLSKVTAQENPYSEESHWFLSKAYIKKKDFRSARTELQAVVSLNGQHSSAAQDLLKHSYQPGREQIREHLSGNYCRCTGYQAIVDAIETTARARAGRLP